MTVTIADSDIRVIDGVRVANRVAFAAAIGKSVKTVDRLALTDEDFPKPCPAHRVDRRWWYPVSELEAYGTQMVDRAPTVTPRQRSDGDPEELLGARAAAEELGIELEAFKQRAKQSRQFWQRGEHGSLPIPDAPQPGESGPRRWFRSTLQGHEQPTVGRPIKMATAEGRADVENKVAELATRTRTLLDALRRESGPAWSAARDEVRPFLKVRDKRVHAWREILDQLWDDEGTDAATLRAIPQLRKKLDRLDSAADRLRQTPRDRA